MWLNQDPTISTINLSRNLGKKWDQLIKNCKEINRKTKELTIIFENKQHKNLTVTTKPLNSNCWKHM